MCSSEFIIGFIKNAEKNLVQKNLLRDKNLFANITAMQF